MNIFTAYATKNRCYKANKKMKPKGIVVHSTASNNKNLSRYVDAPDIVGKNKYGNHWNRSTVSKCVHTFIGLDINGNVAVANILPYDVCPWGCGKGKKGSYNNSHIQFEICEDNLTDKAYFEQAFATAIEYCASLCKQYGLTEKDIVSHAEAHKLGYASNHGDCDHWLKKFGKDMDWFRAEVAKKLQPKIVTVEVANTYKVKITASVLNVRAGASTKYKINTTVRNGEVFTIVDEKDGWGKLKSGAGWISLKYTKKV